jgi:hypothetical protein
MFTRYEQENLMYRVPSASSFSIFLYKSSSQLNHIIIDLEERREIQHEYE